MLAKVSYNAYSSSANAMQRPNKSQNINFGVLNPENIKSLAKLRNRILAPPKTNLPGACQTIIFENAHGGVKALVEFLGFCEENPRSNSQGILKGLIDLMRKEQPNPNYEQTIGRTEAFAKILQCCSDNSELTAGEVLEGITKDFSMEKITGELSNLEKIVKLRQ